jgi:hypothetical protein
LLETRVCLFKFALQEQLFSVVHQVLGFFAHSVDLRRIGLRPRGRAVDEQEKPREECRALHGSSGM